MHGWAADRLGDSTAKDAGRLSLNPLAHIDPWGSIAMPILIYFATAGNFFFGYAKPVPYNPYNLRDQKYGAAKVALAGPAANFITALFFSLVLRFGPSFLPLNSLSVQLLAVVVFINITLMVFNLLPIPPLDGSKILMPFLPYSWQIRFAQLENYGMMILLLFVFFGFSLIIPLIRIIFYILVEFNFLFFIS